MRMGIGFFRALAAAEADPCDENLVQPIRNPASQQSNQQRERSAQQKGSKPSEYGKVPLWFKKEDEQETYNPRQRKSETTADERRYSSSQPVHA